MSDFSVGDRVTHYPDGWGAGTRPESGVVVGFAVRPYGPRVVVNLDCARDPIELDPDELQEDCEVLR